MVGVELPALSRRDSRLTRALTLVGTTASVALTAHTALNLRRLRVPPRDPGQVDEPVSVLIPARNEAGRLPACLAAVTAQRGVPDLQVLVLDDGSTDGTGEVARAHAATDPRLQVIDGAELPPGWLGKPHACAQLAEAATGTVLVFLDADVVLAPTAVAAAVRLLRSAGLGLLSPYPRQESVGISERLVQPLLQWSWLATLPLRLAERSPRPSLSAANGQLLVVDRAAYRAAGGHAAVRAAVLEDIELLRAVKRAGRTGTVADGTDLASCRMYDGWPALRAGYTKSLWAAFGSPAGAAGVLGGLGLTYLVPPLAALRGSPVGLLGYAAGVTGRALVARRVGGRVWPDSLAHPVSVAMLAGLTAESCWRRSRGQLSWKGRALP